MKKVLIPEDVSTVGKDYLIERGYELKVGVPTDVASLIREVEDADALLVRTARYPREVLEAGKKLKVIGRHGTGVDNIDVEAATQLGIRVTNGPLANINAVAEYTCAQILCLGCQTMIADRKARENDWTYRMHMQETRKELRDSVVGIIGLGRIGMAVAEKMINGFGVKVVAYNRSRPQNLPQNLTLVSSIDEVLEVADYVSLHVPSTPQTRGMCDSTFFEKMKREAYFINCARGDVCVEEDLIRALQEGVIRGAALDVYSHEPLDPGSPLLTMRNVLLSTHNASHSQESTDKMALYAAMGIDDVLMGREPEWPVNTL